jgi:hypothetical protein
VKKLTGTLEVTLSRFLFKYRVTPQAAMGIAPAELLMGRRLHTHLDLLYIPHSERESATETERPKGEQRETSPSYIVSARRPSHGSEFRRGTKLATWVGHRV